MRQAILDTSSPKKHGIKVSPVFARHETFHPRFGWIKKGFDAASEDPEIFLRDDAPVRLGVGKNMVRSIRYWCSAFKVLEEISEAQSTQSAGRGFYPTPLGSKLLSDGGWDAFIEDSASLWWLHWNLLKPPSQATAWQFSFNHFRSVEFSAEDLFLSLGDYCKIFSASIADSSLKKDVSCILRMYTEQEPKLGASEDTLDCPFAELGLVYPTGESKRYAFQVGFKQNLPAEIVVAACLEFAGWVGREQRTIALSRLTFDCDSPGLVFKLSESAISGAIAQVAQAWDVIELRDTAGLIQLSFTQDPHILAGQILDRYYSNR